ncbi:NUDIX domain-containing protein [candidate division KSB1 bacterium]
MSFDSEPCPHCGRPRKWRNPAPTVDIIIEIDDGIVFIQRRNPPYGWALPGGFVDYGESLETAAIREAAEETGLQVKLIGQLKSYSDPGRDPRRHTISTVFIAGANGEPVAGDDAAEVMVADPISPPEPLVFDHGEIVKDYLRQRGLSGK